LTIDDGPDGEHTRAAMDLLERHDSQATFFFIGDEAAGLAELVKEVAARGHGVGNHTRSHPAYSFWRLGPRRLREEIEGGGADLGEILGASPKLFRAPAGMRNLFVHPILKRLGLTLVAWSVRGFDGTKNDVDAIVARIESGLRPGAIVLLHERRAAPDGGRLLLQVLPRVIEAVERRGLKMVVPDEFR
jgi:peptidoglycan/xylan/chitin deacetylase (PgdA/CDA1 family)